MRLRWLDRGTFGLHGSALGFPRGFKIFAREAPYRTALVYYDVRAQPQPAEIPVLEYTQVQDTDLGTKNRRNRGGRSHGCRTARRPVPSHTGACVWCLFLCKDLVLSCPVLKTKTQNCLCVLVSTGRTDPSQAANGRCVVISRPPATLGALRWAMKHPHEAPTRRRILRPCP